MLHTNSARMTFITTTHSFQQVIKLSWRLYFSQSFPLRVQQSWKSFCVTLSSHHVIPTTLARHSYHVNHSVRQSTRSVGKSLSKQAFRYLTVILFIQKQKVQMVFVKSQNGQHLGQRNSGHHHMVSTCITLHVLSVFTLYVQSGVLNQKIFKIDLLLALTIA